MASSPYAHAKPEVLAEIMRLAEARLAAQLTAGIAADQRAMTFASFAAAIDAALIATAGSLHRCPWSLCVLIAAFGFAAILAAVAAQPVAWAFPGWRPAHWAEDIQSGVALHDSQAEILGFYEKSLVDNDKTARSNGNLLTAALTIVIAGLMIGGFVALILG